MTRIEAQKLADHINKLIKDHIPPAYNGGLLRYFKMGDDWGFILSHCAMIAKTQSRHKYGWVVIFFKKDTCEITTDKRSRRSTFRVHNFRLFTSMWLGKNWGADTCIQGGLSARWGNGSWRVSVAL